MQYGVHKDDLRRAAEAAHEAVAGGHVAAGVLAGRLLSFRARDRAAAACLLGVMRDSRTVPSLCRSLRADPSPQVQRAAAAALGEIGDPRAIPPLLRTLRFCVGRRGLRLRRATLINGALPPLTLGLIVWCVSLVMADQSNARDELRLLDTVIGTISVSGVLTMLYLSWNRGRFDHGDTLLPALALALYKTGDREHRNEMREAMNELQAAAACPAYRAPHRRYAGEVAALIQRLLEPGVLPIPAVGGEVDTLRLPLPAAPAAPDLAALPRAAQSPES